MKKKELLGLQHATKEEIVRILSTAEDMYGILKQNVKRTPYLAGKNVVNLFYENSTRTRTSFEGAAKALGASVTNISASASSVKKGESLIDTGLTLDSLFADIIVLRHPMGGAPVLLSQNVRASVINGGDGFNEHPTQGLLDMLTMKREFGDFRGLKVVISGDITHSRVARSNIWGLSKMGADIVLSAPYSFIPPEAERMPNVTVEPNLDAAVVGANVVMGLRIQLERASGGLFSDGEEYNTYWGITEERMKLADKDAIVMHPGPINRGIEINSDIADCEQSRITNQVSYGVAVRMAVMYLITRGDE